MTATNRRSSSSLTCTEKENGHSTINTCFEAFASVLGKFQGWNNKTIRHAYERTSPPCFFTSCNDVEHLQGFFNMKRVYETCSNVLGGSQNGSKTGIQIQFSWIFQITAYNGSLKKNGCVQVCHTAGLDRINHST